jgi:hypothetical protein
VDQSREHNLYTLCRLRTTNHRRSVEAGRWKQIIRENRFYHLCSRRELGDEYYDIFECTKFINEKKNLYFEFVHRNRIRTMNHRLPVEAREMEKNH